VEAEIINHAARQGKSKRNEKSFFTSPIYLVIRDHNIGSQDVPQLALPTASGDLLTFVFSSHRLKSSMSAILHKNKLAKEI
jgi:hypothetical protein